MKAKFLAPSFVTAVLLIHAGHADAVVNRAKRTESELQRQHERVQNELHEKKELRFKIAIKEPSQNIDVTRTFEVMSEAGGTVDFSDAGLVVHTSSNHSRQSPHYKILVSRDPQFGNDASDPGAVRDLLGAILESYKQKLASGIIDFHDPSDSTAVLRQRMVRVHLDAMLELRGHLDKIVNKGPDKKSVNNER